MFVVHTTVSDVLMETTDCAIFEGLWAVFACTHINPKGQKSKTREQFGLVFKEHTRFASLRF